MVRRTLRKLKREWENAEPPPPGLEPIIGDFYGSPPADPRDCARWPDSPWCGGNPLSHQPIAFYFSFVRDECNTGVQLDATFGFIKMPSVQFVYRNPECKVELPPPLPPSENEETEPYIPLVDAKLWAIIENIEDGAQGRKYNQFSNPQAWYQRRRELIIHNFSINRDSTSSFEIEVIITEVFNGLHFVYNGYAEERLGEIVSYDLYNERTLTREREIINLEILEMGDSYEDYKTVYQEIKSLRVWSQGGLDVLDNYSTIITRGGTRENLKSFLKNIWWAKNTFSLDRHDITFSSRNLDDFPLEIPGFEPGEIAVDTYDSDFYGLSYSGVGRDLQVNYFKREIIIVPLDVPDAPQPQPQPQPPPPPRMSCCPNVRENDELLRLIAKRLGAYDYPVSVPKILTDRNQGTENIENLTRFNSWLGKNLDALCGKFPIEIKIADADIDQEGNQEKKINIPNIAEGIAELIGLALILRAESDANLNATIRTLTEAGSAKQCAIVAGDYAKANAEFLAYKGTQVDREVPFSFKPGEPRLDKMLVNSTVNVKGFDNDDKDDIKDLFAPLLELAAMYRAANYRNVGTQNTAQSLLKTLVKTGFETILDTSIKQDKINRSGNQNEIDKLNKSDFDQFTEEVERGFIDKTGITDTTKPYGRPLDQRPQIRQIGKTSD